MTSRQTLKSDKKENEITSFLLRISKWVGIIVAILTTVLTFWVKHQEMVNKGKETDYIMEMIITDYNRRICRLENYLDRALEMGAFLELRKKNEYYKLHSLSLKPTKMKKEEYKIVELKKSFDEKRKNDTTKGKSLDDYKKQYQQIQQHNLNKPLQ